MVARRIELALLGVLLGSGACRFESVARAPPQGLDSSDASTDAALPSLCGDGVRSASEACDGVDLGGASCASLGAGYVGGILSCSVSCALDAASCRPGVDLVVGRDINGDAYADVVTAASQYFEVRFGGPDDAIATRAPSVVQPSPQVLRSRVAIAGDLNGDAFADVVFGPVTGSCGDPRVPSAQSSCLQVYFGGPGVTLDPTPDALLPASGNYSLSVAPAGDLNGDLFADVVVGDPGVSSDAYVIVYFGGEVVDGIADIVIVQADAGLHYLGTDVAGVGDVDGDGYDDLVAGNPYRPDGTGEALLFLGGPEATFISSDTVLRGGPWDQSFGDFVAPAGDVDGDGHADVLVIAPEDPLAVGVYGKAFLFLGGDRPVDGFPDAVFGEDGVQGNGLRRPGGTDLDGDGYSDIVLIGGEMDITSWPGIVFGYLGGPLFEGSADLSFVGTLETGFGYDGGRVGDVDGDGRGDLLIGAPWDSTVAFHAGAAHLFLGGWGTVTGVPDFTFFGTLESDQFGSGVGR